MYNNVAYGRSKKPCGRIIINKTKSVLFGYRNSSSCLACRVSVSTFVTEYTANLKKTCGYAIVPPFIIFSMNIIWPVGEMVNICLIIKVWFSEKKIYKKLVRLRHHFMKVSLPQFTFYRYFIRSLVDYFLVLCLLIKFLK